MELVEKVYHVDEQEFPSKITDSIIYNIHKSIKEKTIPNVEGIQYRTSVLYEGLANIIDSDKEYWKEFWK